MLLTWPVFSIWKTHICPTANWKVIFNPRHWIKACNSPYQSHTKKDTTIYTKISLKPASQQLKCINGNGATVPFASTVTGTRPFLAPLPAPGAQGPAQVTTQWVGRMRGTTGHPEIAPLVRNQKESVRGERMRAHGARERRRVGMVGRSVSGCVWGGLCLCVCLSDR